MTAPVDLPRAAAFLRDTARPLEWTIFERRFRDGSRQAVIDALLEFRNDDGGFGHGLEADVLAPTSQPVAVEFGIRSLIEADAIDATIFAEACAYIASVAADDGGVATLVPSAFEHPRAVHWNGDWAITPRLNPTASLAALFRAHGVEHEWIERATAWSLTRLRATPVITSGHTLYCALTFLPTCGAPDADQLIARCFDQLPAAEHFAWDAPFTKYGLTPLDIAPEPSDPLRAHIPETLITAHLDHLQAQQQPDGSWPIAWDPPTEAANRAWLGRWTLVALQHLRRNGRI